VLRLQADSPWAEPDPRLRQEQIRLRRQMMGVSSAVEDPSAQRFRERYGEDGDYETVDLNERARRDLRRLQWVLRPILIGMAVRIGWQRPVMATGATRLAWLVHAAWPAFIITGAAVRSWRRPPDAPLPRANASLVLSTQHLLSQGVLTIVSAMLCAAGHPLDALGFGLFVRVCMFWGLWHWADLVEDLEGRGTSLSPHQLWRTLASALCLMQAALYARVLGATGLGTQAAAAAAVPPELGTALVALMGDKLGAACSAAVLSAAQAVWTRALQAVLGGSAQLGASIAGRLAAVGFGIYAGWWYSFPTEGGVRRHWRSSRTPDWPPLRTTSTLLLRALRVARLEPTLREMMLTRPLTVPPEQQMALAEANRPNPALCLSPIYRDMYHPGPDISEAMELLDCLGREEWDKPDASAEDRDMQTYWVRGDPAYFAFRNGTLMSDAQRERHIRKSFADPMRSELRKKKLSAESLDFTTFMLKPLKFDEDDEPDEPDEPDKPDEPDRPVWRPWWETLSVDDMVANPDAMLLDEPAMVAPSLTLTEDTDDEIGDVWA